MSDNNKSVILFDGVCNLCNTSVQFVLRNDKKHKFHFASLQSDAAKKILLHKNTKKNQKAYLSTIYLVQDGRLYSESSAILTISKSLRFPINLLYVFMIIPKFIRDFFYRFIAKNRYKWFGKRESCMIPTREYLDRFLDQDQ